MFLLPMNLDIYLQELCFLQPKDILNVLSHTLLTRIATVYPQYMLQNLKKLLAFNWFVYVRVICNTFKIEY